MTVIDNIELAPQELDAVAWNFLGSEFAGHDYVEWPIERRVDAYLRRQGLLEIANDGSVCDELLYRVMASLRRARRAGLLDPLHVVRRT